MKWPWNISDDEFVSRVERQLRWRRPAGVAMAAFSSVFVGLSAYFLHIVETGLLPLFSDELTQTSFEIGVMAGSVGGTVVPFFLFSFLTGVYFCFARRKDQLLVAYHQRLVELGELPK